MGPVIPGMGLLTSGKHIALEAVLRETHRGRRIGHALRRPCCTVMRNGRESAMLRYELFAATLLVAACNDSSPTQHDSDPVCA